MTKFYAEITGWGKCLPPATLSNDDLSTFIDTSDEWIRTRTGIENRRISHVNTSDLATVAAQHAMACAGLTAEDIDIVIVATCSPDSLIPNTASKVQQNLGIKSAAAFDLNAACTGFIYGLETATRLIQAGNYRNAIVIGAERLSFFIDWTKRDTAVLFGDGAGAAVLSRTEKPVGLQEAQIGCDAEGRDILAVPKFGTSMDRFAADNGYWDFDFVGKEIFKRAVKGMGAAAHTVLSRTGISTDNIDVVIPHQANIRIIQTLCDMAGIEREKAFVNIQNYGNTSAATVPIAMCEALEQGAVKPGANILVAAFGAGLTWGAGHITWGDRVEPLATSDAVLPENDQTALELLEKAFYTVKRALTQRCNAMNVRLMQAADLDGAARVHQQAFVRQTKSKEWLQCNLNASPRFINLVLELDGEIQGYIIWVQKSGFRPEAVLELEQLAIATEHQGKGLGRTLILDSLKVVKELLAEQGSTLKHVLVTTRADNFAQQLYKSTLGAEVETTISNLYSADEVLMIARNVGQRI